MISIVTWDVIIYTYIYFKDGESNTPKQAMPMWKLIANKALSLPLFLCIILSLGRPMTGIGAMIFYSTNFFQMAGISFEASQFSTIGVGVIIFIMTLVSVPLMDKLGRRTLFLAGSLGQIACHIIVTVSLRLQAEETNNLRPGNISFLL